MQKRLEKIDWLRETLGLESNRVAYKVAETVPGRVKIGNRLRFDREKVLEWIEEGCPAPEPAPEPETESATA